jgi:hypothetical protein
MYVYLFVPYPAAVRLALRMSQNGRPGHPYQRSVLMFLSLSAPPDKNWDRTLKYIRTDSFHFSDSYFTEPTVTAT